MPAGSFTSGRVQSDKVKVLLLPILMGSLSFGILAFMLPIYGKRLGASALEIGGMFSAMSATMALTRLFIGWALDRFGRKIFFVSGLAFRAVSMVIFALSTDITNLFAARVIQGVAASLTWIPVYTLATDLSAAESRGRAVGRVDEATYRGELLGALAGFGLLALVPLDTGWKLLFTAYGLLALAGAWLALTNVPETRVPRSAGPGQGPAVGPPGHSQPRWGGISPGLVKLMVVVFATGVSTSMVGPLLLIFLQDKFTSELTVLVLAYLPASLIGSFLPSRLGRLSDRFGRTRPMALGLLLSGLVSLLMPGISSVVWLAVLWIAETFGAAVAAPAEEALVADITGHRTRGTGYGLYSFSGALGATIGPLLGGWLYDASGHAVPFYANGAVLLVGTLWVLLVLPRRELTRV